MIKCEEEKGKQKVSFFGSHNKSDKGGFGKWWERKVRGGGKTTHTTFPGFPKGAKNLSCFPEKMGEKVLNCQGENGVEIVFSSQP